MSNILFVMEQNSMLMNSLKESLRQNNYNIINSRTSSEEISSIKEEINAIVLYIDEDTLTRQKGLVFIKDTIVKKDIPLFVIGSQGEINQLMEVIPETLIKEKFLRPINVNDIVCVINSKINEVRSGDKKKILVVDDSGEVLRTVKSWLAGKYEVALANSGAMAIKYLVLNRPDLIILDYEMPVVDGKQVLEMIRTETDFADVPVFFLTSRNDKGSIIQVMNLNPEGYLLKTMPPTEIVAKIDEFFANR